MWRLPIWRGFFLLKSTGNIPPWICSRNIPWRTRAFLRNIPVLQSRKSENSASVLGWILSKLKTGMTDMNWRTLNISIIQSPLWRQCAAINFQITGRPRKPMKRWKSIWIWILKGLRGISCGCWGAGAFRSIRAASRMTCIHSTPETTCWPCWFIWGTWGTTPRKKRHLFPIRKSLKNLRTPWASADGQKLCGCWKRPKSCLEIRLAAMRKALPRGLTGRTVRRLRFWPTMMKIPLAAPLALPTTVQGRTTGLSGNCQRAVALQTLFFCRFPP